MKMDYYHGPVSYTHLDVYKRQELYAQLIKHTRVLEYPRTVQGNGLIYLKDEKNMKKFKY